MQHIGKKIRFYREQRKYTQEKLAEMVNISPNYLSAIERGVKTPKLETFVKIANQLEVTSDELLMDNLQVGIKQQYNTLYQMVDGLDREEQIRIIHVVEVMIKDALKIKKGT